MNSVSVSIEKISLLTYAEPQAENLPMFAENRVHQRSTGNPYPNKIVLDIDRTTPEEKEYTVVRLENDYIRIQLIPSLGGRIYSAYDKINQYDFFYKQHVIKPALIGMLGSWISGGLEFNWPCHHRPSTYMPTDYHIEKGEDGSVTVWMSEHEPLNRMKGMVGIYLAADSALFETRMRVYNRTDTRRSFLWWENAAVPVDENYRVFFPHDVSYVQFHYRKDVTTYPLASGIYNGIDMRENSVDIRFHRATHQPTSYFCGETNEDFFGGYDEKKQCGVVHVADRFTSTGKKMFTWAYNQLSKSWENALTDTDGEYAELMAGSYSSNQPDFAWLEPYETKTFKQVWYPIGGMGVPDCANYHAALHVCDDGITLQTTAKQEAAVLLVDGQRFVVDITPCHPLFIPCIVNKEVALLNRNGETLLVYTIKQADPLLMPDRLPSMPTLDTLHTAQDCYLCGVHVDQYRDPVIRPDAYFERALQLDEHHLPSLSALALYRYQMGEVSEALLLANRAYKLATRWNFHMPTGELEYTLGLCYEALSDYSNAYKHFQHAHWNEDSRSRAMTHIAKIDGMRNDYSSMLTHANEALIQNSDNNIGYALRAVAEYRLGNANQALITLDHCLQSDPLDYLANTLRCIISNQPLDQLISSFHCDQIQVALDIAYDLKEMGETAWGAKVLNVVKDRSVMPTYAYCEFTDSFDTLPSVIHTLDFGTCYPYRQAEEHTLRHALEHNENDVTALFGLACLLYAKRRYQEARRLLEHAAKLQPDHPVILRCLSVCYFSHFDKRKEAFSLLNHALSLAPNDQQLLYETAYLMNRIGLPAEQKISLIHQYIPNRMRDDLAIELAQAYNLAGQYEKTLDLMSSRSFVPCEGGEHAVADQYMFAHFGLAMRAMESNNYAVALEQLRLAQSLPQNLGSGLWNVVKLVPYQYHEAICHKQLGAMDESESIFRKICNLKVEYFSDMHLPELPVYQGLSHLQLGNQAHGREILIRFVQSAVNKASHRDAGFFSSTPFFISYVEDAKRCRTRYYAYLEAFGLYALGQVDQARLLAKQTEFDPGNLFAAHLKSLLH